MMAALAAYNRADQERMRATPRYFAWQYRLAAPYLGGRVIEIGCGIGNFTCWLAGREVTAVDPDGDCLRVLQSRWPGSPAPRISVASAGNGSLAAIFSPAARGSGAVTPGSFDSCVALNVLEHIADDGAALMEMTALVRPGGRVILLVPAYPALYGPIDRRLGHFRRYRRRDLRRLAARSGLVSECLQYMNFLGFFGWWFNARLGRVVQSPGQIACFDRLAPGLERLERWVRPPFGQSLFAVLRRAGERREPA